MEFTSADSERLFEAVTRAAASTVVGLDFDGTLSPIVDDPEQARIHPDAPALLVELASRVRGIAVITGRPARQVLALGGLDEVGDAIGEAGHELYVFGQYGNERWTSVNRRIVSPRPPHGLATYLRELPSLLRRADALGAYVEHKGLAVAVHTRRLAEPEAAFHRLLPLLSEAAGRHDLVVEPGRHVVEVRAPGRHKGHAVEALVDELDAAGFVFIGDDLGDVDAFEAVRGLREQGMPTLLVCSGSEEQPALVPLSDLVVEGPEGVIDLLRTFIAEVDALRAPQG
jgi:trehalose 6-phosphate phosphatase